MADPAAASVSEGLAEALRRGPAAGSRPGAAGSGGGGGPSGQPAASQPRCAGAGPAGPLLCTVIHRA